MVGTTPVSGSYLEIKALKMELRIVEQQFQAEREEYSPTTSHTPDTRTQQQCYCFSARFPQDDHKYILLVQPCPLSDVCGPLLWVVLGSWILSGSLRRAEGESQRYLHGVEMASLGKAHGQDWKHQLPCARKTTCRRQAPWTQRGSYACQVCQSLYAPW
jgi:hypothetical protein